MIDDFKPTDQTAGSSLKADLGGHSKEPQSNREAFLTPEEAAASDDISLPAQLVDQAADQVSNDQPSVAKKDSWKSKLTFHWPPHKKELAAIIFLIVLVAGGVFLVLTHKDNKPLASAQTIKAPKSISKQPSTVASTLSGLPVAPAVNQRPVTGVMIENSLDARPQSGLSQASVVFEAVAEGGVTRFLALYQDTSPDNVGPIRSARPYYVQWDLGFDAAYAHVGGSPDALSDIQSWDVHDLNQFYNGSAYHRVTSRPAPHNVYTSISDLNQLEDSKGYTSSTFSGFPRKADQPSKKPTATVINLTLSGPDYNVAYQYNPATNSYNRSEGGAPQIDANTNTQISPKVVIALVIPETQGALDASGAYYSEYATIGKGAAYIFQDGTVTIGQWTKTSNTSQITFTSSNGQTIKLNAGQTWLSAVSTSSAVSYST